jgi:hypothetical protein
MKAVVRARGTLTHRPELERESGRCYSSRSNRQRLVVRRLGTLLTSAWVLSSAGGEQAAGASPRPAAAQYGRAFQTAMSFAACTTDTVPASDGRLRRMRVLAAGGSLAAPAVADGWPTWRTRARVRTSREGSRSVRQ